MDSEQVRFSHDRRFGRFSFEDFMSRARSLHRIVSENMGSAETRILSAEDFETYQYTQVTFYDDEIVKALEKQKQYKLEGFSQENWEMSYNINLSVEVAEVCNDSFMFWLCHDRQRDGKRILFYGQVLDEQTRNAVIQEFRRSNLWYSLGNGWPRPSHFNGVIGASLTGMRPYR